jgi:hypothetical protein
MAAIARPLAIAVASGLVGRGTVAARDRTERRAVRIGEQLI